jgi:hypothetical protein
MRGDMRTAILFAALALAGCGGSAGRRVDTACAPDADAASDETGETTEAGLGPDTVDATAEVAASSDATPDLAADKAPAPDTGPPKGEACEDNRKNGEETDIDCGGPTCAPCGLGQGCLADSDCGSWPGCDTKKGGCACDAVSHACVVNHCVDHKQNAGETAIDCGGGECAGCAEGAACVLHSDCATGGCDLLSATCAINHCSDHVQDSSESDVDCGGSTLCPACAVGQGCVTNFDCVSLACDALTGLCDTDQCVDGHIDGSETDIDCGGSTCAARCGVGHKCTDSTDCTPGHACATTLPHVCLE